MGSSSLFIPLILGTGRKGRESEKVANFVFKVVKSTGINSELIDVRDFGISITDRTESSPKAQNFRDIVSRADGLVIVSPEYNHGYPGELKLALDQIYDAYCHKPVAICGVSIGPVGGARVVEQLRLVAIELQMVPIREAANFPWVDQLFDRNAEIKDQSHTETVKQMLKELVWYAQVLKWGRHNVEW